MSQENVRRVRRSYEVVRRTQAPDLDLLHPDARWHTRADLPDTATYRGPAEIAALLSEWFGAFERLDFDVEELIDAGDRVIAVLRLHGTVRGSSEEVSMTETHVMTMRDGLMIELHEYETKAAALEAAGLTGDQVISEESTSSDLLQLVRRIIEASNRRDFDALESFYAPDCRLRGAEIGEFEGQAAARRVVEDMIAPYEYFHVDTEEILDLGRGVTFAVMLARGRVGSGSAEVQFRFASVATWNKDLVERQFNFVDADEARAAAERLVEDRTR